MERVSAKEFFTTLWRGVCQALGWFFGLFGYKRDGKFAKCVWGVFATSAAFVMFVIACVLVFALWKEAGSWRIRHHECNESGCWENDYVSNDIYYHNRDDKMGYIYNIHTGEKCIKHVAWIARPLGKDSLICFSDGKKRGYFNKYTGKVVVEPKYNRAWIFSDGLASVEENGYIKFIDTTGKVVIDKKMPYIPNMEGYVFHGGYCVVDTDDGEQYGLMDKKGDMVLAREYDEIELTDDLEMWCIRKGKEMAVLDKDLKPVLPMTECSLTIDYGTIDVTMPDHTIRKYSLQGELINDFYVSSVRMLEYEKEEICYRRINHDTMNDDGEVYEYTSDESYHPKATARLRAYVAGGSYEGLMTADGHIVTMPLYWEIEALDHDLYLCASKNGDKVIVNGKGEIVR